MQNIKVLSQMIKFKIVFQILSHVESGFVESASGVHVPFLVLEEIRKAANWAVSRLYHDPSQRRYTQDGSELI